MANHTLWLADQRIFYVRYYDQMTMNEVSVLIQETSPTIERLSRSAHIFVDYRANPTFDFSIAQIVQSESATLQFKSPNIGWTVAIADRDWHYFYLFASFLEAKLEAKIFACLSYDEAVTFVRKQDDSLPALPGESEVFNRLNISSG